MFAGLSEVSKEGEFTLKGDPRVLYSVMMGIRCIVVGIMGPYYSIQSARNAARYCSVRRQFKTQ